MIHHNNVHSVKRAWPSVNSLSQGGLSVLAIIGLAFTLGCAGPRPAKSGQPSSTQHPNLFVLQKQLPANLRRVAVLPLTTRGVNATVEDGRDALQPIFHAELAKTGRFELVLINPDELRQWTGKRSWKSEDRLPTDLFAKLRENTGCDAVIFGELTQYRPYEPVALGWNLKLIECREVKIWWAFDELFDAGNPDIAGAAQAYYQSQIRQPGTLNQPASILSSPRRFGQYTISAAFSTLPTR
jgi:hypothetical protein